DLAGPERLEEGLLVDELAARGVHEPNAFAHRGERPRVDRAARLVRQRQVQRDEVAGAERLLGRRDALDAELAEALAAHERIERDDAHPEPERAACDLLADAAEAEDREGLPFQLDAGVRRPLPAALLERRVRLRDVARKRDEQADGVLRGGDDVRLGRVRHHDAASRRSLHVDVVDAHARAADHAQPVGALQDVRGQLRRRADDDRVVAADPLREVAVRLVVDVEALAQERDAGLGDRLAHEDARALARHTRMASSYASSARVTAPPRSIGTPRSPSATSTAASVVVTSKTS